MTGVRAAGGRDVVATGLVAFGAVQVGLGLFQALAPATFFDSVGPFGDRNDHYVRDLAAYTIPLGVLLLLAVRRRGWRVPVLLFAVLYYALHTVGHLIDVTEADPEANGPVTLALVAGGTVLLAWLLRRAHAEEAGSAGRSTSPAGPPGS